MLGVETTSKYHPGKRKSKNEQMKLILKIHFIYKYYYIYNVYLLSYNDTFY